MKRLIAVTIFVSMSLVIISCQSSFDLDSITIGPNNTVSWNDAQIIICKGDVKGVSQNHARNVSILMKNGTYYQTIEPKLDDVVEVLDRCGKLGKVFYMTE